MLAPCRVLDVTCGTGSVVRRLAARGHVVVGVDPVAPLVERARRASRGFSTCSFHAVDVARQDVPATGTFDAVVSMHTLYWHPEPERVLTPAGGSAPGAAIVCPIASRRVFPVARRMARGGIGQRLRLSGLLPCPISCPSGPQRYLARRARWAALKRGPCRSDLPSFWRDSQLTGAAAPPNTRLAAGATSLAA